MGLNPNDMQSHVLLSICGFHRCGGGEEGTGSNGPSLSSAWGPEMDSLVAKPQKQPTSPVSSISNAFNNWCCLKCRRVVTPNTDLISCILLNARLFSFNLKGFLSSTVYTCLELLHIGLQIIVYSLHVFSSSFHLTSFFVADEASSNSTDSESVTRLGADILITGRQ